MKKKFDSLMVSGNRFGLKSRVNHFLTSDCVLDSFCLTRLLCLNLQLNLSAVRNFRSRIFDESMCNRHVI